MRNKFLTTAAAAALLAGVGIASAQDNKSERAAPAPAAQKNAPPEKIAPESKSIENMKPARDGNAAAGKAQSETTGQAAPKMDTGADKPKAAGTPASPAQTKANDSKADVKSGATTDTKADVKTNDAKPSSAQAPAKQGATTGQGTAATSGSVNLSTEQRSKISASIKQVKVQPATNVNFSISVGTRVPRTVHFYPLPVTVYEIYPDWRGYQFFLVGGQIVVVNPRTLEIVAILEA
jgi:hypothetical protein